MVSISVFVSWFVLSHYVAPLALALSHPSVSSLALWFLVGFGQW